MKKHLKNGFTLAEVLITLAIIGVVAAMTLPTLIQKHQKKVLGERFKQSLSILSQGFQKMMADEGVTNFEDTEWYKNRCFEAFLTLPEQQNEPQYKCQEIARQYFQVVDFYGIDFLEENRSNISCKEFCQRSASGYMTLKNGLELVPQGIYFIDTNGESKPNKVGYDWFNIAILKNGLVVPDASLAYYKHVVIEERISYNSEALAVISHDEAAEAIGIFTTDALNEYKRNIAKCKSRENMDFCGAYLYDKSNFVIDY